MLYFFERGGTVIHCEIRMDWNGAGFELVINAPGTARVERFEKRAELASRWREVQGRLLSEGWCPPACPRR